jgi:ABC-type microcin C transport system duplicated ATPase subunit YejF
MLRPKCIGSGGGFVTHSLHDQEWIKCEECSGTGRAKEKTRFDRNITITITGDKGSGKSVLAHKLRKYLTKKGNIVLVKTEKIDGPSWEEMSSMTITILEGD